MARDLANTTFGGSEPALLPAEMRAFRSWGCQLTLREPDTAWLEENLLKDQVAIYEDVLRADGWTDTQIDRASRKIQHHYLRGTGGAESPSVTVTPAGFIPGDRTADEVAGVMIPETGDTVIAVRLKTVSNDRVPQWGRVMHARCTKSGTLGHPAPQTSCTCGLYAWYRSEEAVSSHTGFLTGTIQVRGRATLGTRGLRVATGIIEAVTLNPRFEGNLPFDRGLFMECLRYEATSPASPYHGMLVYDSLNELVEAHPPELDTLRNLLGDGHVDRLITGTTDDDQPMMVTGSGVPYAPRTLHRGQFSLTVNQPLRRNKTMEHEIAALYEWTRRHNRRRG